MDQKLKEEMCNKLIEGDKPLIVTGFMSMLIGNSFICYDEASIKATKKIKNKRDKRIRYPRL